MRALAPYREALSVAVWSVNSSKLRSFLTLLGIICATTTLIVVMSIVHGMDVYVAEQVSDMGPDGFQVQRIPLLGDFDPKKLLELERKNPKLTAEEFHYLKSHLTLTREFGMQAGRSVKLRYHSQGLDAVDLAGITANIGVISDITVTSGRFITETDDLRRTDVVFIGEDVRDRFFPSSEPVGKTITVDGKPFQVIGTAAKKGSVFGFSRDNFVMIPIGTFFKTFGTHPELSFNGLALDRARLEDAQDELHVLLRASRRLTNSPMPPFPRRAPGSMRASPTSRRQSTWNS